jgi:hypothetical protein
MEQLVEQLCKMSQEELQQFARECMRKGIAVPLEFALHSEQLFEEV